jgi:hypothetical protein
MSQAEHISTIIPGALKQWGIDHQRLAEITRDNADMKIDLLRRNRILNPPAPEPESPRLDPYPTILCAVGATVEKVHHRCKPVKTDRDERFGSVAEGARAFGLTHSAVVQALKGNCQTTAGRKWMYLEQ